MNPLVYLRDVNNLSDARYCAAMGVDLIGFRLDPLKEESLTPAKCKEIAGWISGVKIVGEFGSASSEVIKDFLALVNIDFILAESGSDLNILASFEKPLIIQTPMEDLVNGALPGINQYNIAYLLLISESIATNIPKAKNLNVNFPLILGYGITTENVAALAGDYGFAGISLTGGTEERPGYKDYDEMAEILEVLQGA
jgi:phosphoribosylanthranilate isomerase